MSKRAAKKSVTPTKVVKKSKGTGRYEYQELSKVSLTSQDHQHVYGVIIDASFPYKVNKEKYVCSLKIVDPSLNSATKGSDNYATVVIYAKRFEDLPIVHRIGDLIRLHRATLRLYNNHRQFNVSTHWNGSWALFSTDKHTPLHETSGSNQGDNEPFAHSGKRATIEPQEKSLLSTLRKWASQYFHSHDAVTKDLYKPLNKAKGFTRDFDVVAKIVSLFEMDEYTNELKLIDASGSSWYTLAIKLKFPHLRAGQVVRIRSAQHEATTTNKQVLSLSHYSNIATFISGSRLAAQLGKISDDEKVEKAALATDSPSTAVTISQVAAKYQNLPHTSLHDLFHNESSLSGDTHRVCFNVTKIDPSDAREFVQCYEKGSKKTTSAAKGAKGNLFWHVQFQAKDASTQSNTNQYRILNYSHEGLGANFFGKAENLHSSAAARKRVEGHAANLLKFNVWVDAIVEKKNGWYYIKDTTLKH